MRSVFIIFKAASRTEVVRYLDDRFARNGAGWIHDDSVSVGLYDQAHAEFEPELLERLHAYSGRNEVVAVMADISGKIPGDHEVLLFCSMMLGEFNGWAMDDYSSHLWSIEEIRSKSLYAGHSFFDYSGWHVEKAKKERNPERSDAVKSIT